MPTVFKKNIPDQLEVSASGVHRDASSVKTHQTSFVGDIIPSIRPFKEFQRIIIANGGRISCSNEFSNGIIIIMFSILVQNCASSSHSPLAFPLWWPSPTFSSWRTVPLIPCESFQTLR